MSDQSISQWIKCLKAGEADAAQKLWARYSSELVHLAHQMLGKLPRKLADEDDVVVSVFASLCRGAAAGRFERLSDRDDLWWLLIRITKQKVVDQKRHALRLQRDIRRTRSESELAINSGFGSDFSLDHLIGDLPTPDFVAMLNEQRRQLADCLRDDTLRLIADRRIEGCTHEEIARELGISRRSVIRKIALIQKAWERKLRRASDA